MQSVKSLAVENTDTEKLTRVTALLVLLAGASAWAQTADQVQPSCPGPPHTLPQMTYDEDVRYLQNPACRNGFLDSLQFIPLRGDDENYYLSLGTWIRERGE